MCIFAALHRFAKTGEGDVKKLQGSDDSRLRVGDYHVRFITDAESIKAFIEKSGSADLQQAVKRIELQIAPVGLSAPAAAASDPPGARTLTGAPSVATADAPDPI